VKILLIDSVHPSFIKFISGKSFTVVDGTQLKESEIRSSITGYTGIVIRSRFPVDKSFLDAAGSLRFIARAGSGMENIDSAYAASKGIICISAPEGNRDAVAEHAAGMLLSLLHNIRKADHDMRSGVWKREENRGTELGGKTIAMIGFGNTGSAFAKKITAFDVSLIAYDKYIRINPGAFPYIRQVEMQEIFEHADVLSLHVPLTEDTRGLVNANWISRFKKSFFIVNTSRGSIVNTRDLTDAIDSGKIRGACLDVFDFEDSSFSRVQWQNDAYSYLKNSERVIMTPHIAGWTHESNEKIAAVLAKKILELKL